MLGLDNSRSSCDTEHLDFKKEIGSRHTIGSLIWGIIEELENGRVRFGFLRHQE